MLPNEGEGEFEGEVEKSVIQGGGVGTDDKKKAAKKKQLHELFYEEINLKTFTWFCYKFNLYPEILHPTDAILIYRSLTSKKRPLDIHEADPLRDISKAGGALKCGLTFEEFKQALLRLAIKGKKIFNIFAVNLQQAAMSSSTMKHEVLEGHGGLEHSKLEQTGDETGTIQKTSKLVDEYGKIEECTADTLRCLLFYLGFPKDKMGIEERFRQVMEQNVHDDKKHKKLLEEKFFLQDPQMLEEFYKLQKIDPNLSIMDVSKIDLNKTMQQSKIIKKD